MIINVATEEVGERLDKFVLKHFPDFSRSHIQASIKKGAIKVSGKKVAPKHPVKIGETISVEMEAPVKLVAEPNKLIEVPLIFKCVDYLIVNKPSGMVVHQGEGHGSADTLVNGLLARYKEIREVGGDPIRPGIVHRLDRGVSGVMVVARTPEMYEHLVKQFADHTVYKEYAALVVRTPSASSGTIDAPVGRSETGSANIDEDGKEAITEYEVLKSWNSCSLLKIVTKTGRMHQIRVHLNHIGHPILGDEWYGNSSSAKATEDRQASAKSSDGKRLMLHARKLAFTTLQGKKVEYEAELPEEFER